MDEPQSQDMADRQSQQNSVLDPNELGALAQHIEPQQEEAPSSLQQSQTPAPDLNHAYGNIATQGLPQIPVDNGPVNPGVPAALSSTPTTQGYASDSEVPQGPASQGSKVDTSKFAVPQTQPQAEPSKKIQSPEDALLSSLQKSAETTKQANKIIAENTADTAKNVAKTEQDLSNELLQRRAQSESQRMQISNNIEEQNKKLQNSIADIQASKIDPNRANILVNGDTSQKIVASIALGLGAFSAAINKTGNPAMDMLNRTIDRDIDAQKAAMSNKIAGAGLQNNLLSHMQNQFHNSIQAEEASRIALLSQAQQQLNAFGAQNDAVKASNGYKIMNAQIDSQMADAKYKFGVIAQQRAILQQFGKAVDNPHVQLSASQEAMLQQLSPQMAKSYKEANETLVPSLGEYTKDVAANKSWQKEGQPLIQAHETIQTIQNLAKDFNSLSPTDLEKRAQIQSALQKAMGDAKNVIASGPFREFEKKMVETALGDPTKILSLKSLEMAKMKQFDDLIMGTAKGKVGQYFKNPDTVWSKIQGPGFDMQGIQKRK